MAARGSKEGIVGDGCPYEVDEVGEGEVEKCGRGSEETQMKGVAKASSVRGDVRATEVGMAKRGYGGEEEGRVRKRSKMEVGIEEEEGLWEIDSRYREYLYETWMWGSMQECRFAFPDVLMWYWLVVLKE